MTDVEGSGKIAIESKQLITSIKEISEQPIVFSVNQDTYQIEITYQNGKYNLRIRKMLETIYVDYPDKDSEDFKALEIYLKRVWFSSGIHHHYGCEKFVPGFSQEFLRKAIYTVKSSRLPLQAGETLSDFCSEIFPVIFNPDIYSKRVNQAEGDDLIQTSAAYYYDGVTQQEAEEFYNQMKDPEDEEPVMYGMNSRLVKQNGKVFEKVWKTDGLYGEAISCIVYWLRRAMQVAENDKQRNVIGKLIEFYRTGDLKVFDEYSIAWVNDQDSRIDFNNGFIETYGDPLGLKASWESIVDFKDLVATKRTETISSKLHRPSGYRADREAQPECTMVRGSFTC